MTGRITGLASLCAMLLTTSACARDYDALYKERFDNVMANKGYLVGYEPMEEVQGTENYSSLPLASEEEISIAPEALAKARAYAEANNSTAFMVWHKGKLIEQTYFGEATAATPLVSKSLSKPLGSAAIGRAIKLGKIKSLDQPVADFIPEWKGTPKEAMLIRHMLDMRSGFLAQGYSKDPNHPWNTAFLSYEHGKVLINSYPMPDTPGTKFSYNNATAELVALVIERATGQRYSDFIGQEILAKVGAPGGSIWVDRPGGLAHSGCCMYLPAESFLRLALLFLKDGKVGGEQLLPEGYVADMRIATPQNPHYGLGVYIAGDYVKRRGFTGPGGIGPQILHSQPYPDKDLFLFDGNSNQVVYVLPKYDMIILRMGSTPPKSPEWDNSTLPNILVDGLTPATSKK